MKNAAKSTICFSAYPLKAVKKEAAGFEPDSPFLEALLSGKPGRPTLVLPMLYTPTAPLRLKPLDNTLLHDRIELSHTAWFNNYE